MALSFVAITLLGITTAHVHQHRHLMAEEEAEHGSATCGTEQYMAEQIALDPSYQDRLDAFEEFWQVRQEEIESGKYQRPAKQQVVVPVVYHILYNTNAQNVPDSTIAYQQNVLNDDFAGSNADLNTAPNYFTQLSPGDMGIYYTISQVIRKQTSQSSFGTNNGIKYDSQGGSNVVNPASNLNYWSGQLSGGLLGYAQFPGGNSATDGVVNLYSSMSPEVGGYPYNLGRTATHEIGHWLNLRHIWGDTSNCVTNDFVDDTPPSSGSNGGCPSQFPKRCTQNPYVQDMGFNYMDYSYDDCLVLFTQGQNERAWASIDQYRGGFNPQSIAVSDREYVNWLYFMRFEEEVTDDDMKCYGENVLFYDNNLNENSGSNVYIYGCLTKTNVMSVSHMTDIKFIHDSDECEEGYTRASQDLNEGNEGEIYLCYSKAESNDESENMAVLDITFLRGEETNDEEWVVTEENINPNGVKLKFAVKKGEYYNTNAAVQSGVANVSAETVYISVGVAATVISLLLIGLIVWKYVCTRKGLKGSVMQPLDNEYGAVTELTQCK